MTTTAMRKKLAEFCITGDLKKVKAMYTMVEDDINAFSGPDDAFKAELDKRDQSYLDGSAKMYSIEEAKTAARARITKK